MIKLPVGVLMDILVIAPFELLSCPTFPELARLLPKYAGPYLGFTSVAMKLGFASSAAVTDWREEIDLLGYL